jgi:hypothetical protein
VTVGGRLKKRLYAFEQLWCYMQTADDNQLERQNKKNEEVLKTIKEEKLQLREIFAIQKLSYIYRVCVTRIKCHGYNALLISEGKYEEKNTWTTEKDVDR